jgi:predicted transcriptional regulator
MAAQPAACTFGTAAAAACCACEIEAAVQYGSMHAARAARVQSCPAFAKQATASKHSACLLRLALYDVVPLLCC